jgi:hypothetical protein
MRSVNKVILLGNLTRNPELKQTEGKNRSAPLDWQRTGPGPPRQEKSGKSQSFTVSLPGINGQRFATGIWPKAEKSTLRGGCSPTATPAKTG